jgi:hypothetical protein
MILSRPVKRPIGPSTDQQATLRVDSQQSLGAVRAVFRAWPFSSTMRWTWSC